MRAIPIGYKQTEVGVIPEDWNAVNMEKITAHIGDGLHGTPIYSPNGDYFFVNGNNLSGGKVVVTSDTKSVNYSEFIKHRKPLTNRSILLSINGTIGNVALFDDDQIVLGKSAAYLNIRPEVCKHYIYNALQTDIVRRQFFDGLTGSTIGNLGLATIRKTQIPLPSTLPEQRAIAAALSDVDALLAKLDQLIAKKRDLKQATMQQFLTGQTRLPGFSGAWEVKRLGDVASLLRDNVIPANYPEQYFIHFSLPAFDADKIPVIETGSEIGSNKFRIPQEAVLVSKLNPRIPRIWAPTDIPVQAIASTEFLVLLPKEAVSRNFLFVLCSSPYFCAQMELAATGTTGSHQRISPSVALNITISLPTEAKEQTAIATVLSDMDAELAALEARRDKTRALKQGMMQELLTGRIRLV